MANLINHLQDSNAARQVTAVAAGRHTVRGHLAYSYTVGASPNHTIYLRQVLGKGQWEAVEAAFYELPGGTIVLPPANYRFYDGSQTTTGEWFPEDVPHTGFVIMDVKLPQGMGDADTKANPPTGLLAICKCEKFPDFDAQGNQIDRLGAIVSNINQPLDKSKFFYTANPARVRLGWSLKYGKIKRERENYPKWAEWRDFCAGRETVDYTRLPGFKGFGLTGEYFNGTNFQTLAVKRIEPSTFFASSAGAPATGVNADNFSVRWTGFIKAGFSETYTFTLAHTNGARVKIGAAVVIDQFAADGTTPAGTHTGTLALIAGQFYPVEILWNHGTGNAEFSLRWQSRSLPIEIIPPEWMYPAVEEKARYQANVAFSTPTSLETMIDSVLLASNSIRQDADGKMICSCVEQLTASFHFDENLPESQRLFIDGTIAIGAADIRAASAQNVFEAEFGDLDSQYLEKTAPPLSIAVEQLKTLAGREITGSPISLPNMTRFQAFKVLSRIVDLTILRDTLKGKFTARSYSAIIGDIGTITHSLGSYANTPFQLVNSRDLSPEESADERELTFRRI
ncbi:MAG TPA: PA14 domain-containing protein [Pyrinomonadaceae bacterium]|nr:PA14 domain-containing protein [Pyrinomonadaceae bacterium]